MSLYGNVKKIGSASFQFDRKYNNRVEMDNAAATDGVYAGRYVLVEYGYRFGIDGQDVTSTTEGTGITESNNSFKLVNTPDGEVRVEGVTENTSYKNNATVDLRTYGAVYDSTVWQKIYINDNGTPKDKYVMVAELNASAPKLDIIQDAPLEYKAMPNELPKYRTEGVVAGKLNDRGELIETVRLTNAKETYNRPRFDTAIDTELTYLMHIPTTLNLELGDNTVDFNENGFNIAYSYPDSEGISAITWLPKGHDEEGNPVYLDQYTPAHVGNTDNAGNSFALLNDGSYSMDTKMLFMSFPALGNAMNALYNLIYGKPDPNDDIQHGAMRPYFKRFLNSIDMKNRATVLDNENKSIYITSTNDFGEKEYVYIEGKVGKKVEAILNPFDALALKNLQPSSYVEVRFKDESSTKPYPYNYYPLSSDPNSDYGKLEKDENGIPYTEGSYVLFDSYRNEPITMTIHTPTGDEDPDLDWLKKIPALADILSNNTTGLATVLSSIFGTTDPLTGTTKYYLYNDWTMSADDGSSGPAIANKPRVVGGYEQTFAAVLAGASNKNILGDQIYKSPGYMWDYSKLEPTKIDYPHTEIVTSDTFSGGTYSIDFNNWQLIDYQEPSIKLVINKLLIAKDPETRPYFNVKVAKLITAPADVNEEDSQFNQDNVTMLVAEGSNVAYISSYEELRSFASTNPYKGSGKWIGIDIDTGLDSIIGINWNNQGELTQADEDESASINLPAGHIIYWVKAENITDAAKTIVISDEDHRPTEIRFRYMGIDPNAQMITTPQTIYNSSGEITIENENANVAQANQNLIHMFKNGNTITFNTPMELNSYERNGIEGKWVCFDVDTGFKSVVKLQLNEEVLTDEYEDDAIHGTGVGEGHLAIWLDADDIILAPASFKVSAAGFNDASFTIQYIHSTN